MKRIIVLVMFITVVFVFNGYSKAINTWQLVKKNNGVAVYIRELPDCQYNEVKAVAEIDAPIEVISGIIGDVDAQTKWMSYCRDVKIVKDTNELEKTLYYYLDMPWPLDDRDVVFSVKAEMNRETASIVISGNAVCMESIPRKKDRIRIIEMTSTWLLEMNLENKNKTKVYFTAKANPGGLIPAFAVNYESKNEPFKTVENLKRMSKEDKYIKLKESFREKAYVESLYGNNDIRKKILESRKKITPEVLMKI